jgi:hypothetical protein
MTEQDDEMFAGMIAEALGTSSTSPNAREITTTTQVSDTNARGIAWQDAYPFCVCGSKQYAYNLFDHTGKLLMYCCNKCEKGRRTQLDDDGEILTGDG